MTVNTWKYVIIAQTLVIITIIALVNQLRSSDVMPYENVTSGCVLLPAFHSPLSDLKPRPAQLPCKEMDGVQHQVQMSKEVLDQYRLNTFLDLKTPRYLDHYANPCWFETGSRSQLRCMPGVIAAGFTKCGTTELYRNLVMHPDIVEAAEKELNFWGTRIISKGSLATYVKYFDPAVNNIGRSCIERNSSLIHHKLTLDSSPQTIFDLEGIQSHKSNAGLKEPNVTFGDLVHHLMPKTKIIVMLRNPVTRLYSEYLFYKPSGNTLEFTDLVKKGIRAYESCFKKFGRRACAYTSEKIMRQLRMNVGLYEVFLSDLLEVVPRDQVFIMRLEDYSVDKIEEMKKLYRWLDLDDPPPEVLSEIASARTQNLRKVSARSNGDIQLLTRKSLELFYAPHNKRLAKLLRNDKFTWGY